MNNYDFIVDWVQRNSASSSVTVLDYGCGGGTVVSRLRELGVDAFGCDVYYEGGDASRGVSRDLFDGGIIRRMDSQSVPFPDDTFDLVVTNQVIEHVADLRVVLREISRVLKPGGKTLNLFPHKEVWWEGHCGIPFLHRFPKGSVARVYYAAAFRALGFGYFKGSKPVLQWSRDFCEWLDEWTHYRPAEEIVAAFRQYVGPVESGEAEWLHRRFGSRALAVRLAPRLVRSFVAVRLGGLVLCATKPKDAQHSPSLPS